MTWPHLTKVTVSPGIHPVILSMVMARMAIENKFSIRDVIFTSIDVDLRITVWPMPLTHVLVGLRLEPSFVARQSVLKVDCDSESSKARIGRRFPLLDFTSVIAVDGKTCCWVPLDK